MPCRHQFDTDGEFIKALRDYFAAKALPECVKELWGEDDALNAIAKATYQIADAMLAEREKGAK